MDGFNVTGFDSESNPLDFPAYGTGSITSRKLLTICFDQFGGKLLDKTGRCWITTRCNGRPRIRPSAKMNSVSPMPPIER
jgi:hypothetical protein